MKESKRVGRAGVWMDEAKYDFDTCLELHTLGRFNSGLHRFPAGR